MIMKIASWNVNGIMPCLANSSFDPLIRLSPDIVCIQEVRTNQRPDAIPPFHHFWNSSERSGYAGVLSATQKEPLGVVYGLGDSALDREGRLLTLEFERFYSVNAYFPQSQGSLARHNYRMAWDEALREKLLALDKHKPVILCGDFNTTRSLLDVYPENERIFWAEQGYMSEERESLEELLEAGFTDVFRSFYPEQAGAYTWWSNRLNKRKQNRGWRLDYFCVSNRIVSDVQAIQHHTEIFGSDHCPILMEICL